jgi:hypothetical protein
MEQRTAVELIRQMYQSTRENDSRPPPCLEIVHVAYVGCIGGNGGSTPLEPLREPFNCRATFVVSALRPDESLLWINALAHLDTDVFFGRGAKSALNRWQIMCKQFLRCAPFIVQDHNSISMWDSIPLGGPSRLAYMFRLVGIPVTAEWAAAEDGDVVMDSMLARSTIFREPEQLEKTIRDDQVYFKALRASSNLTTNTAPSEADNQATTIADEMSYAVDEVAHTSSPVKAPKPQRQ